MPAQDRFRRLEDNARSRRSWDGVGYPTKRVVTARRMTRAPEASLSHHVRRLLIGRVCILGVGNRYRRDDGAGSLVAEQLEGRTVALSIDAGEVPENYLEKVARSRPDTILIIDAVDFGGAPGELRVLEPEALASSRLSTHGLSLRMTAEFLRERTQARFAVLAIQPTDIALGTELSAEVSQAVRIVKETLLAALHDQTDGPHNGGGNGVDP